MVFADITRKQAFATHLSISMAIFFVLLYLIIFYWYPSYYFHIDGGYRGIATIFFVDVVLGPGLTWLLFKPGKPGLKFDMTVVVALQVAALTWGLNNVVSERPALTVFYDGKFSCMNHAEVSGFDIERLAIDDKDPPLLAVLPRPDTHEEYQDMMLEAFGRSSAEIYVYGEKFLPMDVAGIVHLMNYKLDVENSFVGSDEQKAKYSETWMKYIEHNPDAFGQYLFYPMSCRYRRVLAVFDPERSEIVDFVPVYTERAVSTIKLGFTEEELKGFERRRQELDKASVH